MKRILLSSKYHPKVHQNAGFCLHYFKIFPGVIPPDPLRRRACTLPQRGLRPRAGALRAPGSAVPNAMQYNYWRSATSAQVI